VWCFLASARLRRLKRAFGDRLEVEHRCFALAPDPEAIARIFGSPAAGKAEILTHWEAARRHPDGEAINVEGMRARDFPYPYSWPGLKACKAAELQGGPAAHWDMFDRVQRAHAVEARNIADFEVLRDCARDVGLDLARWERDFFGEAVERRVRADLQSAERLGVYAVPTLIFNDRWRVEGAVPEAFLREVIEALLAGRDPHLRR